jgi:hypothetical protein
MPATASRMPCDTARLNPLHARFELAALMDLVTWLDPRLMRSRSGPTYLNV